MILQGVLGENCKPGDAIAWFLPFLHALATTGTSTYLLGDMVLFSTLVSALNYFFGTPFGVVLEASFYWASIFFL